MGLATPGEPFVLLNIIWNSTISIIGFLLMAI